jgi:hypothetical protein
MIALIRMLIQIDVRGVLPLISVPTLVVHRDRDAVAPVEGARYMAAQIPGARLVELAGEHSPSPGTPMRSWTRSRSSSPAAAQSAHPSGCSRP